MTEEKEEKEEKKKEKPGQEKPKEGKYKDLIKQIESLSLADLSQLVKELEEKFGVSVPTPQVVGAAPTALSTEAPTGAKVGPAPVEKSRFTVILSSAGANKIAVIKAVREVKPDLGLKDAKDFVEGAPKTVLEEVSKEDAEAAKKKLEEAGATVELK